ncbi:unnamed protein product [Owenia fusiformis]|uniref:CUE domain-containing protein n=1 Tax=Owenia fusiformis TaxID=6347 RepID=A0A8S4PM82_OWEFU|nr:unnamed protein product [Owenia fusiformis]
MENDIHRVRSVCPDVAEEDICKDLELTQNVEETINRIFDGTILQAVDEPDSPIHIFSSPKAESDNISSTDENSDMDLPSANHIFGYSSKLAHGDGTKNKVHVVAKSGDINTEQHGVKKITFKSRINNADKKLIQKVDMISDDSDDGCKIESKDKSSDKSSTNPEFSESDSDIELEQMPLSFKLKSKMGVWGDKDGTRIEKGSTSSTLLDRRTGEPIEESDYHSIPKKKSRTICSTSKSRYSPKSDLDSQGTSASSSSTLAVSSDVDSQKRNGNKKKRSPEEIADQNRIKEFKKLEKQKQKDALKLQKQKDKETRVKERLEKKLSKDKDSAQRRCLQEARKNAKPGECLKFMSVVFDSKILESPGGAAALGALQGNDVNYLIESQPIPNSITWVRKTYHYDQQKMTTISRENVEDQVLIYIPLAAFIDMVNAYSKTSQGIYTTHQISLNNLAQKATSGFPGKTVTFYTQGLEKYFKGQKTVQQRNYRGAVLGKDGISRNSKASMGIDVSVSRVNVEEALIDLHLQCNINVRIVETNDDAAKLIMSFTKSVAETPYKRDRLNTAFTFNVEAGSGSVKISTVVPNPNVTQAWRKQMQQFKNVSAQIADAIVAAYPSPQSLIQAYRRCSLDREKERLLENIAVRRGAGVLESSRRIGKELSRRVYQLFTSNDPDFLLK